jgi:LPXTG-motif cell wall-anchored protein
MCRGSLYLLDYSDAAQAFILIGLALFIAGGILIRRRIKQHKCRKLNPLTMEIIDGGPGVPKRYIISMNRLELVIRR